MSAVRIPIVGIIGGIGSGKTALTNALADHLKVCRIDADSEGHQVLKEESVKAELQKEFGNEIFEKDQTINRSKLARLVFGETEEQKRALEKLESIVHPQIRKNIEKQLDEIKYQATCDVIILDAALMLETGWSDMCDAIVFLDVPREVRLERTRKRGWSEEEFNKRESSQLTLSEKEKRANLSISNDRPIDQSSAELAHWIQSCVLQKHIDSVNSSL